jgi:hypothetical protein
MQVAGVAHVAISVAAVATKCVGCCKHISPRNTGNASNRTTNVADEVQGKHAMLQGATSVLRKGTGAAICATQHKNKPLLLAVMRGRSSTRASGDGQQRGVEGGPGASGRRPTLCQSPGEGGVQEGPCCCRASHTQGGSPPACFLAPVMPTRSFKALNAQQGMWQQPAPPGPLGTATGRAACGLRARATRTAY